MRKNTRCRWAATADAAILAAGGVAAAVMPSAHGASKAPVVEILLENTDYSSVVGDTTDAPYINNTLIPSGTLYTNYYAVSHPSLPNYLALVTGGTCGKDGTDNVTPLCSQITVFN